MAAREVKRAWNQFRTTQAVDLTQNEKDRNGLKRCLNKFDLIAYGLGSCVGAGVFVTTGEIAAFHSGGAVCLSFLFAGIAAMLSGLCYGEFAARIPIAGSAYSYSYASLGEFMAWIMGWNLCLEYGISAGTIAVSWSSYVNAVFSNFGVTLPKGLTPVALGDSVFQVNVLGLLIVLIVTGIQLLGCNLSAKFNLAVTCWNVTLISFVIVLGFTMVDTDNWSPFMPFGFDEVLVGAGIAFFSYVGFDAVSSMAAEAKNPQTDIPIGLMGTLGVATTLYILISLAIAGMVPYLTLQQPEYTNSPISQAFEYAGSGWAAKLVAIGSVTTLTCTTLCAMLGQPRILLAMAQDGLLPPLLGRVNKRKVPVGGTICTCIVAGALAFFFTFDFLADSISLGTFMAFSFVCCGVLMLRLSYDPEKVDASSQAGKRILPAWMSVMMITWYGLGSWVFWIVLRRTSAGPGAWATCVALLVVVPLVLILYSWYRCVLVPPAKTFQTPLMPWTPLLGVFVNGCLMAGLDWQSYQNLAIWTAAGLVIYFSYGFRHSKLRLISEGTTEARTERDEEEGGPAYASDVGEETGKKSVLA